MNDVVAHIRHSLLLDAQPYYDVKQCLIYVAMATIIETTFPAEKIWFALVTFEQKDLKTEPIHIILQHVNIDKSSKLQKLHVTT